MAGERPLIGLGDLLRADDALRPADTQTRARLYAFLHMSPETESNQPPEIEEVGPRKRDVESFVRPVPPILAKPIQPAPPQPTLSVVPLPSVFEVVDAVSPVNTGESEGTPAADIVPLSASSVQDVLSEAPQQLFRPLQERGILSAALATRAEDGPLDTARLIEVFARGEVLQRIFCVGWPTLRRGVQLLVDRSEAMMPFAEDQEQLLRAIQLVAGIDKTTVLGFAGSPQRGTGEGPITDWIAYQPPPPGTLVVLISDLGIGRGRSSGERADVDEWCTFALDIKRAGCRLVAFVPYAKQRWPSELQPLLTMIPWDRSTTATTVRSLMMPRSKERR